MNLYKNHTSNEQNITMDLQILRISRFHSLIIAKTIGSILLLLYCVTAIIFTRDSIPSFYILAANNILPFLLTLASKKKRAKESLLPLLSKKYHYTYQHYICNSISFVFVCILLYLWQQREMKHIESFSLLTFTPVAILFVMFMIRVCGNIYYRHKIQKMLLTCDF